MLLNLIKHQRPDIDKTYLDDFFCKKNFHNKMSLKNPKTLRKCQESLQPQIFELQF